MPTASRVWETEVKLDPGGEIAKAMRNTAIGAAIVGLIGGGNKHFEVQRTEAEWKESLTPPQYYVMREHGTECAGSSPLARTDGAGTYHCAACNRPLYSSDAKFKSCTGWPSFFAALDGAIATSIDFKMLIPRKEVHCSCCGSHLGHVFGDGPAPTGQRHCINGIALTFRPLAD